MATGWVVPADVDGLLWRPWSLPLHCCHRYAPALTIAPFLYVSLLTHSTAGYLVFGQVPDEWTLAGAAIVILTGLYLLHLERITARAAAVE